MSDKFTIRDGIMQDSLGAIGLYTSLPDKYKLVVVGGVATQLYARDTNPDLLRPTYDVDLSVFPRLDFASFKEDISKNLTESLSGYNPKINKTHWSYELALTDKDGYPLYVHASRDTPSWYERNKKRLERLISDATLLDVPSRESKVYVERAEDLIRGKLRRLRYLQHIGILSGEESKRYDNALNGKLENLSIEELAEWLTLLKTQRDKLPAFIDSGIAKFKEERHKYMASKDLFDIALISRLISDRKVEFDEKYFSRLTEDS